MKNPSQSLFLTVLLGLISIGAFAATQAPFTTKYVPPEGKIRMFMGQDTETIIKYQQAVPEDNLEGVTLYTAVYKPETQTYFDGVYEDANWGAGPISYTTTLQHAPDAALAIGLGFSGEPESQVEVGLEIARGKHDKQILEFAQYLKSLSPRPVFLRIGWEFDGFWFGYRPESYKAAFRHIHGILEQAKADNVVTVWHSAAWPDPGVAGDLADTFDLTHPDMLNHWYPGDDVVDWAGISVFYRDLSQWGHKPPHTPQQAQQAMLDFARKHNKPILIAEAAPQGYRTGQLSLSPINQYEPKKVSAEQIWDNWYQPFFNFVHANNDVIRAVAYINTHWDDQPMWQCAFGAQVGSVNCNQGNWGDSRIQVNPLIRERWLKEVLNETRWLQTNPEASAK